LPNAAGTQTICTYELANCAGAGSGITGTGTTNYVARFNSGTTINASGLLYDNGAFVGVGNTTGGGLLSVTSQNAGQTGVFITSAASSTVPSIIVRDGATQTGDLIQFQNSAGTTVLTKITAAGDLLTSATATIGSSTALSGTTGGLNVLAGGGAAIGAVIRAGSSQTGDLLRLQNSSGTSTGGINASGNLYYNSGSFTGTLTQQALTASASYQLPTATGSQTLCTYELGNCAGSGSGITGTGTNNYVARFNSSGTINASSLLYDDGTILGAGTTTGNALFNVKATSASQNSLFALGSTSQTVPVTIIKGGASPGTGADLLQLQVDGGTTVASFDRSGNLTTAGSASIGTGLTVVSGGAAIAGTTTINTTGTAATSIGNNTGAFSLASSGLKVSTAGAVSGVTTLVASGAITAATSGNTINGLIINGGALSGITGYTQTSGNFGITGTGTFSTGSGAISLNGNTAVTTNGTFTTGTGTVTLGSLGAGLVQSDSAGVLSSGAVDRNSTTFFSNSLNVANGGTGAATFTANGILFGSGSSALQATAAGANSVLITNGTNTPSLSQTLPLLVQGNITQVGALAAGSIATGFGVISTGNAITTTAAVTGNTLNATGAGAALQLNGTSINTAGTLSNVAYLNQANTFTAATNTFTNSVAVQGSGGLTLGTNSTAGKLIIANGTGNNLSFTTGAITGNVNLSVPVAASGTTDTLCLQTLANCGTTGAILGSGTINYIAKFDTSGSHIGNSSLFDNGTFVGINNNSNSSGLLSILGASSSQSGLFVQAAASATTSAAVIKGGATPASGGDLLQLQNSAGAVLAKFDKLGALTAAGATITNLSTGLVVSNSSGVLSSGALDRNSASYFNTALTAANGGTGLSSLTTNSILYATGATTFGQISGSAGQVLLSNATGVPTFTTIAGDFSLNGTGAATINSLQGNTLTITSPATGQYLRYNGSAFVNSALQAADITGTLFTVHGGSAGNVDQTIASGQTINFLPGASNNLTIAGNNTRNLTFDIISNPTFTGTITASNSGGTALAVTGTPSASATAAQLLLGSSTGFTGDASTNGGTYVGINAPTTGAGSAADFLNFQTAGTSKLKVSNSGLVSSAGGFAIGATTVIDNARNAINFANLAASGSVTFSSLTNAGSGGLLVTNATGGVTATTVNRNSSTYFNTALTVANGGTNLTSLTTNSILYATGTTSFGQLTGTAGQVLLSNASGVPTFTTLSGDIGIDGAGATVVNKLQGNTLTITTPAGGQYIRYNGSTSKFENSSLQAGDITGTLFTVHGGSAGNVDQTVATGQTINFLAGASNNLTVAGSNTRNLTFDIISNPSFTGTITDSNSGGTALAITGTPTAGATNAQLLFGNSGTFTGNASVNGGTYVGINEPSTGVGSAADFVNFQVAGASKFSVTNGGVLTLAGAINAPTTGNTINNLVINNGALSGITGYTQISGNFGITGTGTFSTGTGAISLNGATSVTGTNTLSVGSGAVTFGSLGSGLVQSSAAGVLSSGAVDRNSASYFNTTLTVGNGGTGLSTLTTNSILYASGTGTFGQLTGSAGQLLLANASGVPTFTTLTGDVGINGTGVTTVNKLQGNTLTITTPATGQYIRYNGSAFVNSVLQSADLTGTVFSVTGSGANSQAVASGQTIDFKPTTGGSGNITVAASATRTISIDIIQNPSFTDTVTASNSSGIALAVTGTPTASATAAQLLFGASGTFTGNANTNGGTYIGINEPSSGAGSAADFINFQVAGASKFKVTNGGALTANSATISSFGLGVVTSNGSGALASGALDRNSASYFNTALTVGNGGTGLTTLTANGVVYGSGTSNAGVTAAGITGQVLIAGATGVPTFRSISGDVSITATGATTINNLQTNPLVITTPVSGQYLRYDGTKFANSAIQAGDLPSLSGAYIVNGTSQQASANFNIQALAGTVAAKIQGASGQNIVNFYGSVSATTPVATIDGSGNLTAANGSFNGTISTGTASTAGSLLFTSGAGNTVSIATGSITNNITATFPTLASGTQTLCLQELGNCTSSTSAAGNTNYIAKFTSGTALGSATGNASLFDDGGFLGVGTITNSGLVSIQGATTTQTSLFVTAIASATTPVAIIKGGATPGAGADLLQLQNNAGTTIAKIDQNGNVLGTSFDTANAAVLHIGQTNATSIALDKNTVVTGSFKAGSATQFQVDTAGNVSTTGSTTTVGLVNSGSTLNSAITLANFATGGSIGSAASTVDVATTINITQTSSGQTLILPTPTTTNAGRIVYINATSTADFTVVGQYVIAGQGAAFEWNGTAWTILNNTKAGTGLTQSGNTINSAAPTSVINDTNIQGSIAGNALTLSFAGTLSTARGGTGLGTYTTNGVLFASTSSTLTQANGTSGQVLLANGSGVPTFTSLNGDVTVTSGTGATNVAKIQGTTFTISGPTTNQYLRYNGSAFVNAALQSSDLTGTLFTVHGNGGASTDQTVASGQTLNFLSGTTNNLTVNASATRNVTVDIVSNPTFTGLITGTGGATITGAVNINTTGGGATNIGNASGGAFSLVGGTSSTISTGTFNLGITSNNFNVGATTGNITAGTINTQTIGAASSFTGTVAIAGPNALTLGTTGTNTGAIVFRGSTAASGTLTLVGPANPNASNYTLTIPTLTSNESVCVSNATCAGYAQATALTGYVQLQSSTPGAAQVGHLNINGTAIVGSLQAGATGISTTGPISAASAQITSFGTGLVTSNATGNLSSGTVNRNDVNYFNTTLTVANGGTGLAGLTTNSVLYASGTGSFGQVSGSAGQVLLDNASGVPTFTTLTGDIGINGTGATTINSLQGNTLTIITPTGGQYLRYNGATSKFENSALQAGDITGTLFTVHGGSAGNVDQTIASGQTVNFLPGASNNLTIAGSNTRNLTFDIISNPSFTGTITASNSSGTAVAVTGAPSANANAAQLLFGTGASFTGNNAPNGGTYIGINEPNGGATGSAADFLNFQVAGVSKLKVDNTGLINTAGGLSVGGTVVIDSSRNGSFVNLLASGTIRFSGITNAGVGGLLIGSINGTVTSATVDRNSPTYFNTTLTVANGGTGVATIPAGGVVYGAGTSAVGNTVGTAGQLLFGTATNPSFTTVAGDLTSSSSTIGSVSVSKLQGNTLTISAPTTGQYLRYNGSAFVNAALGAADITGTIFNITGSGANTQSVSYNQTIDFAPLSGGSGNITVAASATRKISIDIVQNPTFTGLITGGASTTGLALTGTPTAGTGITSLLQLGGVISGGNSTAGTGGTYVGINEPAAGNGSTADFLNFQAAGTQKLRVDTTGLINTAGGLAINGNTVITSGRAAQNLTGIVSSGAIQFSTQTNGGAGGLLVGDTTGGVTSATVNRNNAAYFNTALTVSNGGTGLTSLTTNSILYATGATTFGQIGGTAGQVLLDNASGVPTFTTLGGDIGIDGTGTTTVNKIQGTTFTIASPATGQYLRYNGSAFVNAALGAADISGTIFSVTGSGANAQSVTAGQTVDFAPLAAGSGNLTVSAGATRKVSFDIISNPTFTGTVTSSASTTGLALTGTPTAGTGITSLFQLGGAISGGNSVASGGTYIGINEPAAGNGSAADFLNFQTSNTSKLKITNTGLINTLGGLSINGTSAIDSSRNGSFVNLIASGSVQFSGLTNSGVGGLLVGSTNGTVSSATVDRNDATYFNTALTASNGGTGRATLTTNSVLFGNGTGTVGLSNTGTAGQTLIINGSGVPTFTSFTGDTSLNNIGFSQVNKIQGVIFTPGTPNNGQYLRYNSGTTAYESSNLSAADLTGTIFTIHGGSAGNTDQTVASGQTLNFLSGASNNLTLVGSNTRNLTVDIISNPSFSGLVTASASTTGLALTGTPTAGTGITSLLQLGGAISGGNSAASGGTYVGINEPASGNGSAADFLNFQVAGAQKLRVDNNGLINTAGGLAVGGSTVITNGRAAQNLTGIVSSGTIQFSTQTNGGAGGLLVGSTNGTVTSATVDRNLGTYFNTALNVGNGGTGDTTLASGGVLIGAGSGNVTTATGTAGQLLFGTATNPTFTTVAGDLTSSSTTVGSISVSKLQNKTLTIGATPVAGDLLLYNGSAFVNQAITGDIGFTGAGFTTINKLQNNTLSITSPIGGQFVRYNGGTSQFENSAIQASDISAVNLFTVSANGGGSVSQTVRGGDTLNFNSGSSNNLTVIASTTRQVTVEIINNPTFSGTLTDTNGSATNSTAALALTGAPTASSTVAQFYLGASFAAGDASVSGGTYIGINAPAAGAGSVANFLDFKNAGGASKLKVNSNGLVTSTSAAGGGFAINGTTVIDNNRNATNFANLGASGSVQFTNTALTNTGAGGLVVASASGTLSTTTVDRNSSTYFASTALSTANGGTGQVSFPANSLLLGNAGGAISNVGIGAINTFLQSNGTTPGYVALSGDATLSAGAITVNKLQTYALALTAPNNGDILIYDTSGTPGYKNHIVSGDVTITGAGVTTIGAAKVDNTKIATPYIKLDPSAANTNLLVAGSSALNQINLGNSVTIGVVSNPTFTGLITATASSGGLLINPASTKPAVSTLTSLLQVGSNFSATGGSNGTFIGINTTSSTSADFLDFQNNGALRLNVDSTGLLNAVGGFQAGTGNVGSSLSSCSGFLSNPTFVGGIITAGTCTSSSAFVTLQTAYNNSAGTSPQILLNNSYGGFKISDGTTAVGAGVPLLDITNNGGTVHYFDVTASQIDSSLPINDTSSATSFFAGDTKFTNTGSALDVTKGTLTVGDGSAGFYSQLTANPNGVVQTFSYAGSSFNALNQTVTNTNTSNSVSSTSGINQVLLGSANSNGSFNNTYALNISTPATATTGNNFYGVNFTGNNFKDLLTFNGTQLFSGSNYVSGSLVPSTSGKIQNAAFDAALSYSNINKVGTLTSGSIAPGFGSIATSNFITTSALLGGGTLNVGSSTGTSSQFQVDGTGNVSVLNGAVLNIGAASAGATGTFNVNNSGALALSGTGGSPELTVTSLPTAAAASSLIQLGSALNGGASSAAGGTYIGLNAPATGAGSVSDLINLQNNGVSRLRITSTGVATIAGATTLGGQLTVSAGGANITGTIQLSALGAAGNDTSVCYNANLLSSCTNQYETVNGTDFIRRAPSVSGNTITASTGIVGLTVQGNATGSVHSVDIIGTGGTSYFAPDSTFNTAGNILPVGTTQNLGTGTSTTSGFANAYLNTSLFSPAISTIVVGGVANGITLNPGTATGANNGSGVTITGGNASGTGTGGNVSIDAGTGNTGASNGSVSVGTTNATSVTVGSTTKSTAVLLQVTNNGIQLNGGANASTNSLQFISTSGATGRTINIAQGQSSQNGDQLALQAGQGSATGNKTGGNLLLQAGAGGGTGASGSVVIKAVDTANTSSFQIQSSGGTAILTADTTANLRINIPGQTALTAVQLSTASVVASNAEVQGQLHLGTATNYVRNNGTGTALRFYGTARNTTNVTLVPEFPGAVLSSNSATNLGTMTSDFCSSVTASGGNGGLNVNAATACATAGDQHNYYTWTNTQAVAQDYDIYTRWQVPSNFDPTTTAQGLPNISFYNSRSIITGTNAVTVNVYNGSTLCGTATSGGGGAAAWELKTYTLTGGACTLTPGTSILTFDVHLVSTTGANSRIGEILINYLANF
jgi:hypothetical protein